MINALSSLIHIYDSFILYLYVDSAISIHSSTCLFVESRCAGIGTCILGSHDFRSRTPPPPPIKKIINRLRTISL